MEDRSELVGDEYGDEDDEYADDDDDDDDDDNGMMTCGNWLRLRSKIRTAAPKIFRLGKFCLSGVQCTPVHPSAV